MILLDTNVVSEAFKPAPSPLVVDWLNTHFGDAAISSITIFALGAGVALMEPGRRREALETAITRMVRRFGARVYAFDAVAARAAARLLALARQRGVPLHQSPQKLADLQIAGIASAYDLDLATRNLGDFEGLERSLTNPWIT